MADEKVEVSYDDYDLQTDDIIIEKIIGDDSLPPKSLSIYELPIQDSRRITLQGVVKNATASGLIGKLEEIKEVATRKEKTLVITQPGANQRIYTASVDGSPDFSDRPAWAVNIAPFKMSFICTEPWAVNTQTAISGVTTISGSITSFTVDISGDAKPQPIIYFNTTNSGTGFIFNNKTTNKSIEVRTTYSGVGRQLIIDTQKFFVKLDGIDKNFKGIIPEFDIGTNEIQVLTTGEGGTAASSSLDQYFQDTALGTSEVVMGGTWYQAQSFQPSYAGLSYVEFYMKYNDYGPDDDITVQIRTDNGGVPSNVILGETTIQGFNSTTYAWHRAIFDAIITLTPGTTYWIVCFSTEETLRGTYLFRGSSTSQYSKGVAKFTYGGKSTWYTSSAPDKLFRTYIETSQTSTGLLTGDLVIQYNPRKW